MRWFYIIAAVVVVGLGLAPFYLLPETDLAMLTGLTPDPLPPDAPPGTAPTYHPTSVLYDVYVAKVKSLDPATCGDNVSGAVQGYVYEGLYAYHFLKRPLTIIPALAQSLPEVSADGLTYTIRLKRGANYHRNPCFGIATDAAGNPLLEPDGKTPLYRTREATADDFVLAFKRVADYHITTEMSYAFLEDKIRGIQEYRAKTQLYAKGDFSRYDREIISGIKALDRYTLQIQLAVPFPQLVYVLAISNYAPVPRETLDYWLTTTDGADGQRVPLPPKQISPEIHDYRAAVGTGAYYYEQFVDGGKIVLRRNPDFRPEYYPTEGAPGDREAGLLDDAGKRVPFIDVFYLDYVPESNPMWMLFLTKQSDISAIPQEVYSQVITLSRELSDTMRKRGITLLKYTIPTVYWLTFNMDDRVLGASKSLRQALNLAFNTEEYIRVLHNDRGTRATNLIPTGFEGHDEAGPGPYNHYDPAAAKAKLADARKELIAAGVIGPNDSLPALTLDLGGTDEETRRVAEFIQQQFKAVGVELKVQLQDWPTLLAKMNKRQCQIYMSGWGADYPDPENFLQLFYTPNIKRGTNNSGYSNPEFDRLYEQAVVMQPSPQRTEIYVRMIRMLGEDVPMLLTSEPVLYVLVHPWVHNVKPAGIGYSNAKYRRIDAEARRRAGGR